MDGLYDIFRGEDKIGKAEVKKEGLYYRFRCTCELTGEVMYRITVSCGDRTENLGIPAPSGDCFYLQKKLPVSHFSKGAPVFQAVPKHQTLTKMWVAVSPEAPFDYVSRLENAVMQQQGSEMGILIPYEDPTEPDSDPIP